MNKAIAAACAAACIASPALASSLTTGFFGGNALGGVVFDIEIAAADITVTALEVNLYSGDSNVEIYYRLGGYAGNTGSLAGWTLWDSATPLPANARDTPTPWDVADQVFDAGQTYGIYFTTTDSNFVSYTNGSSEGALWVSDSALSIFQGRGFSYPFGFTTAPRVWNGTIIYDVSAAPSVPLPAALPMALAGLGALAAMARRRA